MPSWGKEGTPDDPHLPPPRSAGGCLYRRCRLGRHHGSAGGLHRQEPVWHPARRRPAGAGCGHGGAALAQGNLWRATKDGATLHLLGTYHLPDPRHDATLERVEPILQAAQTLLVEAGPEEERALKADLARDPGLLFLQDGPSLMERMPPEEWQILSAAMTRRNIPAVMAAKMRPWYLAVSLAMPPCSLPSATTGSGLDQTLASRARAQGIAIRALEPHTTVFRIFEQISEADQIAMIRTTLLMEDRVDDYAVTMADSYFAEDSRRLWSCCATNRRRCPAIRPKRPMPNMPGWRPR